MKKPRKPKTGEPSLREKLSASYLAAFENDFAANGVAVIEALRNKSPDKYADIAARLISTSEPTVESYADCKSVAEMARKMLKAVGCDEPSDSQVDLAVIAHSNFIMKLEEIRDQDQQSSLYDYATPVT
jgi:hypothetical protein